MSSCYFNKMLLNGNDVICVNYAVYQSVHCTFAFTFYAKMLLLVGEFVFRACYSNFKYLTLFCYLLSDDFSVLFKVNIFKRIQKLKWFVALLIKRLNT